MCDLAGLMLPHYGDELSEVRDIAFLIENTFLVVAHHPHERTAPRRKIEVNDFVAALDQQAYQVAPNKSRAARN